MEIDDNEPTPMDIQPSQLTPKSIAATQRMLSNMALLASIVTIVEKVSTQLNKDDAMNCSQLTKDTVSHLALSRVRRHLNLDESI